MGNERGRKKDRIRVGVRNKVSEERGRGWIEREKGKEIDRRGRKR